MKMELRISTHGKRKMPRFIDNNDSLGWYRVYAGLQVEGNKTTITNRHEMPLGSVNVTKRLVTDGLLNGDPAFTFVLEGTDVYGNEVHQEQTLTLRRQTRHPVTGTAKVTSKRKLSLQNPQIWFLQIGEKDPSGYLHYLTMWTARCLGRDGRRYGSDHWPSGIQTGYWWRTVEVQQLASRCCVYQRTAAWQHQATNRFGRRSRV